MDQASKSRRNWIVPLTLIGVVLTGAGVLATLGTDKEIRCRFFGISWSCPPPSKTVELVVQDENGQPLGGVAVIARGIKGAPVRAYSDDNGYVKINIESVGDVGLTLSKAGYATQNSTLNIENKQDNVMVFKFSETGRPSVHLFADLQKIPPPIANPYSPPVKPVVVYAIKTDFLSMEITGVSKDASGDVRIAFVINNLTNENLYLGLSWGRGGSITDNYGRICDGISLKGLETVDSRDATPADYTLISPKSAITVATTCQFPNSTEFNASFPLVRFQLSATSPDGELTHFNAGFRGIKFSKK
jgi:hypothetical protein